MGIKNILIVDDDATNRKLLHTILKMKGFNVIEAENGLQALEELDKNSIDLIFLDLIMPMVDGIKFMDILKKDKPQYTNIPIVVLTTDDSKKEEAKIAGAKKIIIKPINPADIFEIISNYSS